MIFIKINNLAGQKNSQQKKRNIQKEILCRKLWITINGVKLSAKVFEKEMSNSLIRNKLKDNRIKNYKKLLHH